MKKFRVTIDLQSPETHRAQIRITALAGGELPDSLRFPVWTPGSYFVRDYSRNITRMSGAEKLAKNTWRLTGNRKEVSYEVYGYERTVRTTFIDDRYITLVGASLLPLLHGSFEIVLLLPKDWSFVSSALRFRRSRAGRWVATARDDDHWIDSPIVSAAHGFGEKGSFVYKGMRHHIAWVGTECARPMAELERDFKKIAEATVQMFGGAPFREYWFLLHFGAKLGGGLEHRDSQLSQFDGSQLSEAKDYESFLRLIAHEYFHAWNVKSLRPRALGPFDYDKENYTEDLWFAEGITDYFDDLIPWEAGLATEESWHKARLKSAQIMSDGLPAQKRRALRESSFDAWIRYYRPDEDSDNTDVSYYVKGALLAWCWDAELRQKSHGRWTLAKLLREMWREFGVDAETSLHEAKAGYTRAGLLAFAADCTGIPHEFVEDWVSAREALPWRKAAKFFHVPFEEKVSDPILHRTGAQIAWKQGQAVVSKVISGSAAEAAGIATGDELIAINDWRCLENERMQTQWKRALGLKKPVHLTLCRLEKVYRCELRPRAHSGVGVCPELKS